MSTHWKTLLFVYLTFLFIGGMVGLLWLLGGGLDESWRSTAYLHYAFAGCVGGTLYAIRMFHRYYDEITQRFVYWYVMRPFLCAGTAVMTILLFESDIMLLQVQESLASKIGVAFLSGFGYGKFVEKLTQLTETLFSGKEKDTVRPNGDSSGGVKPGG